MCESADALHAELHRPHQFVLASCRSHALSQSPREANALPDLCTVHTQAAVLMTALLRFARLVASSPSPAKVSGLASTPRLLSSLSHQPSG